MNKLIDGFTPVTLVQSVLSVLVVLAFIYQEITIHTVDPDLKVIAFGVIGFWLGGIVTTQAQRITNGVKKDE